MERTMICEPVIEHWRPVVGNENSYEVSDLGRVRSLDRVELYVRRDQYTGRDLIIRRSLRGRMLRPGRTASGHVTVTIGKGNSRQVHQLVLEAFVGPCPPKHEGRHLNDIPDDNRLSNLRWGTRRENLIDAVRNGKRAVGERHHAAKLTTADVSAIRTKVCDTSASIETEAQSMSSIAREYGVTESCIRKIVNGTRWVCA
ncbi:NUMOD4 motif-containing HNH endonuclease [Rhodopseudomonas palustris]|uniref:NUMOD4 motif-containing HNH endonuclease n=1 Tax=Rhodopseudomonas palustris TaxID=1076 RepID=UPI003A5BD799